MASKTFKYGHLWSNQSGATPDYRNMIPGEIAINLHSGDTHIWSTDGTQLIDLTSKIGGNGDERTVHAELVNGNKEFSSLVWIKEITAESSLPANVYKRYALVDADGNNIMTSGRTEDESGNTSNFIDIYKDASIVEIYVGTKYDEVNESTGEIDKKVSGDTVTDPDTGEQHVIDGDDFHYLDYVYYAGGFSGATISGDGKYYITHVDINQILNESKFASGVTVNAEGIITGVVDDSQDLLITEWTKGDATNAGTSAATESGLTVGESGFSLVHVQEAINAKHANTIIMSGYTSGASEDLFAIEEGNTVMQAIKKIEDKLYSNGDGQNQDGQTNNTGIVFVEGSDEIIKLIAGTFGD